MFMAKKIAELMLKGDQVAVVGRESVFRDVLELMDAKRLGEVNVVENGKLAGIITDGDIRRLLLRTQLSLPELFMVSVDKLMVRDPKAVKEEMTPADCLRFLED